MPDARDTLKLAYGVLLKFPGMDIDQALLNVLEMPGDAREWTKQQEADYCSAVSYLRKFLPIWSITGWSCKASNGQRANKVKEAAWA